MCSFMLQHFCVKQYFQQLKPALLYQTGIAIAVVANFPNATNDWTQFTFFYLHIQEISKVVFKKLLSGVCSMKLVRAIKTTAC